MKKKNGNKLSLARETLQVMNGGHLGMVRGAAMSIDPDGCDRDLTIPDSVCQLCGGETLQSCDPCFTGGNTCLC